MKEKLVQYKLKCKEYLSHLDIHRLRNYGRYIGVSRPAAKAKDVLIEDIVAILAGELPPIPISKRGAPVKNQQVDENIIQKIEEIKAEFFTNDVLMDIPSYDFEKRYEEEQKNGMGMLRFADPAEEERGFVNGRILRGQVLFENEEYYLYPEECPEDGAFLPIPLELIKQYDLRIGDVISCQYREKNEKKTVAVILTVNDRHVNYLTPRGIFEECEVRYSQERLHVFKQNKYDKISQKYVQWLMPITKGQRVCLVSSPKAGKSKLLLQFAESIVKLNEQAKCFALLVDQSYESIVEFRRIFDKEQLFYTTYEDDADRQVFVADFVLQRAKRLAESGKDVVLFIDSLTSLAHAFNDTEASSGGKTLACGLETKTVRYLKKYFGTARCLQGYGSITIIGTLSVQTGNLADDIIASDLCDLSTTELWLSAEMAMKRIYPALDLLKTRNKQMERTQSETEEALDFLLRKELLPKIGSEGVLELLSNSQTFEDFERAVKEEKDK
jgi:transcription termination factor Rho